MKNIFPIITTLLLCGFASLAFAQTSADTTANFVAAAKASSDSQLGTIASELTGKMQSLSSTLTGNATMKNALDGTLKSLTGGMDSDALTSAFKLAESAKLTPEQLGLAKQVGNLTSAYVVQKNFASLDGAQGDVATIVKSLREGKVQPAIPAFKSVAQSAHLSNTQKQLITTMTDKYVPGLKQATGAMDSLKKIPGF